MRKFFKKRAAIALCVVKDHILKVSFIVMKLNMKTRIISFPFFPLDSPSPVLPYPKISFFPWTEEGKRERVKILGYGTFFTKIKEGKTQVKFVHHVSTTNGRRNHIKNVLAIMLFYLYIYLLKTRNAVGLLIL